MKYYTEEDMKAIMLFMSGWLQGKLTRDGDWITAADIYKQLETFKPRDIRDLIEYPLKKEKI